MESKEARDALHLAERAALAPWIDYPPPPRWMTPLIGVYCTAVALNVGLWSGWGQSAVTLALVAAMMSVMEHQRRRAGTWPKGRAPGRLRYLNPALIAAAALAGLAAWAIGELVSVWAAAAVAGVAGAGITHWYYGAYARVSAQLRARLA